MRGDALKMFLEDWTWLAIIQLSSIFGGGGGYILITLNVLFAKLDTPATLIYDIEFKYFTQKSKSGIEL